MHAEPSQPAARGCSVSRRRIVYPPQAGREYEHRREFAPPAATRGGGCRRGRRARPDAQIPSTDELCCCTFQNLLRGLMTAVRVRVAGRIAPTRSFALVAILVAGLVASGCGGGGPGGGGALANPSAPSGTDGGY